MRDKRILDLFFDRDPEGLSAVLKQYGGRLVRVASGILRDGRDVEECVNDTLMAAWDSIPPQRPEPLLPWLIAVTRNYALKRWERAHALKRGAGEIPAVVEELDEVLGGADSLESQVDRRELVRCLDRFLDQQTPRNRAIFLGRYFSGLSWAQIALPLGLSEEACKMRANRLRKRLTSYLKREGVLE